MNQKTIQNGLIAVIIACILISGYVVLNPASPDQGAETVTLAPVVNGKQEIAMTVFAVDYSPSNFKVKAGIPVAWEITSSGQIGCASGAVFAKGLVDGPIYLDPAKGQVKVVEFTPQTPGTYRFNCSMNMARGTIQVVE